MMIDFFKKNWKMLGICLTSLVIFFPSLFKFFTNDDFFFLKIANVSSLKDFLSFFNLVTDVGGIGVYRPLTLRVFYFLGVKLFNLNPLPLHIISFISFFVIIYLVGKLAKMLTDNNKIATLSSFLYAVSVTHFGQLYYVGAFQELCLTALFLLSVIFFIEYEVNKRHPVGKLLLSFLFFVLAILSKETAVVLPFILILIHLYLRLTEKIKVSLKILIFSIFPFVITLGIYLFLHFHNFGTISGDSYVWNFSLTKVVNTLGWYALWSFNLPETLVDFVGPGLHFNPNLLKYWSGEIIPIFILFVVQICIMCYAFLKSKIFITKCRINLKSILLFSISWFVITLAPILFLPVHKFTYYLTLPLVGVVIFLSYLLAKLKSKIYILFCIVWTITSILTLRLTIETNWIIQGENVAERVYIYFKQNKLSLTQKNITFIDTSADATLPWSPTATLKTVLSDKSFFDVFYPDLSSRIYYAGLSDVPNGVSIRIIRSRQFLGY